MKMCVTDQEIEFDDALKHVLLPLAQKYSALSGVQNVDIFTAQDKLDRTFFIIYQNTGYFYNLEALTIGYKNNNLSPLCIGQLFANIATEEIKGVDKEVIYISTLNAKDKNIHIGSTLINTLYKIAQKEEIETLSLISLPESLEFYKKLGFVQEKENSMHMFLNISPQSTQTPKHFLLKPFDEYEKS